MKDLQTRIGRMERQATTVDVERLRAEFYDYSKKVDLLADADLEDSANPVVARWYVICEKLLEYDPEMREALDELSDEQLLRLERENE